MFYFKRMILNYEHIFRAWENDNICLSNQLYFLECTRVGLTEAFQSL